MDRLASLDLNDQLLSELILCKEAGHLSAKLVRLFDDVIALRCEIKTDDVLQECRMNMIRFWNKMNLEKSTNAYSFFSTIVHGTYLRHLHEERKELRIRESLTGIENG